LASTFVVPPFVLQQADGQMFGVPINLSRSRGQSTQPDVAASGSNVYVVWSDNTNGQPEILFSRSLDYGRSFNDPEVISAIPLNVSNLLLGATQSSQVSLTNIISHARPTSQNLTRISSFSNLTIYDPSLKSAASGISVISNNSNPSSPPSSDTTVPALSSTLSVNISGLTTSGLTTANSGWSFEPSIAASGSNVYVVWTSQNGQIFFRGSTNNGNDFSPITRISNSQLKASHPDVAAEGNKVYIVWQARPTDSYHDVDIYYRASANRGIEFSSLGGLARDLEFTRTKILNFPNQESHYPTVAASQNRVYVVWSSNSTRGDQEIFSLLSQNGGSSFHYPVSISRLNEISVTPKVASDGSVTWISYRHTANVMEVAQVRYTCHLSAARTDYCNPGPQSISDYINQVNTRTRPSSVPSGIRAANAIVSNATVVDIASYGNLEYIAWGRRSAAYNPNYPDFRIGYLSTQPNLPTFSREPLDIALSSAAVDPSIAVTLDVSSSTRRPIVYVVWTLETPNSEIYFRADNTGAPIRTRPIVASELYAAAAVRTGQIVVFPQIRDPREDELLMLTSDKMPNMTINEDDFSKFLPGEGQIARIYPNEINKKVDVQ
jgi:hypothetical protein